MELFGLRVKKRRTALAYTQNQLAKLAGIERSYLSYIENLKTLPSDEVARKLAIALKEEDSEEYVKAIRIEKIIIREEDRTAESVELSNLPLFAYCLNRAEKNLKYQGFSAAGLILTSYDQFINIVNKDISLHVMLAEPSIKNLYSRALERTASNIKVNPDSLDDRLFRIQQQQIKLWTAFYYFRLVQQNQSTGIFDLRLDPCYSSHRYLIVDGEFCLERPLREIGDDWFNAAVITNGSDAMHFKEIQRNFIDAWNRSRSIDWDQYDLQNFKPVTKSDVAEYEEKQKQASSSETEKGGVAG